MIKYTWDIDQNNSITAAKVFGKSEFCLNGEHLIPNIEFKNNIVRKAVIDEHRTVTIELKKSYFLGPSIFELKVNDKLILPNSNNYIKPCSSCNTTNKPNDKFCKQCGTELPSAETIMTKDSVNSAKKTILILAAMFTVFGTFLFFTQQKAVDKAMTTLNQYQDSHILPQKVNGKQITVGELRNQIKAEQWSPLIANGVLALIMLALALWAKNNPLPAIIVAAAVYTVVMITNAIIDPRTIVQGILIKIIIITILYKGIKSSLALHQPQE